VYFAAAKNEENKIKVAKINNKNTKDIKY